MYTSGRVPRADPARHARARRASTRSSTATAPRRQSRSAGRRGRATEGSGAADEDDGSVGAGLLPVQALLRALRQGPTTVTAYDDETTELTYACAGGFTETVLLSEHNRGKLVWKVDWPMRWAYEGVVFEPSGVDHSSPGSSFVVGGQIVREVFGGEQPIGPDVRLRRHQRHGQDVQLARAASRPRPTRCEIMEAPLLRWLYARRRPNQSFKIAFDQEIQRLYDEWDALAAQDRRRVAACPPARSPATPAPSAPPPASCSDPAPAALPHARLVADITTGRPGPDAAHPARPRPGRPGRVPGRGPAAARPGRALGEHPGPGRPAHARARRARTPTCWRRSTSSEREALRLLVDGPRRRTGRSTASPRWSTASRRCRPACPPDAKPTPELKAAQRAFFALLYRLLVGRDTGPRLPTLLLAVGRRPDPRACSTPAA